MSSKIVPIKFDVLQKTCNYCKKRLDNIPSCTRGSYSKTSKDCKESNCVLIYRESFMED